MWFSPERLATPALRKIIAANRSKIEYEVAELMRDIMDYCHVTELHFVVNGLMGLLNYRSVRTEPNEVRRLLKKVWKLEPQSNTLAYRPYEIGVSPSKYALKPSSSYGRYFTVTKDFLDSLPIY